MLDLYNCKKAPIMMKKLLSNSAMAMLILSCGFATNATASLCAPILNEEGSLFSNRAKPDEVVEVINGPILYQATGDELFTKGFRPQESFMMQGSMCQSTYDFSKNVSSASIIEQLKSALARDNYQVSFECKGTQCGDIPGWKLNLDNQVDGSSEKQRYMLANYGNNAVRLASVMIHISEFDDRPRLFIKAVVRPSFHAVDSLLGNRSKLLNRGLTDLGSVYFASRLSNDYEASTLESIAQSISSEEEADYLVVGYSDTQGDAQKNYVLSQQRATQVVNDLTSKFQLTSNRFWAIGGGELPSNSNSLRSSRKATIYKLKN